MQSIEAQIVQQRQAIERSRDIFIQSCYELIRSLSTKIRNPEFCDVRDKFVQAKDLAGDLIMEKSKPFITLYAGRIIAKDESLLHDNFDQTIASNAQQLAAKSDKSTTEATEYITRIVGQIKNAWSQYTTDERSFMWTHMEKLVRSLANYVVAHRELKLLQDQKLERSMQKMSLNK